MLRYRKPCLIAFKLVGAHLSLGSPLLTLSIGRQMPCKEVFTSVSIYPLRKHEISPLEPPCMRPLPFWQGHAPARASHALLPIPTLALFLSKLWMTPNMDQAPALGLALLGRRFIRSTGRWGDVSEPKTLRDVNEKPFQKFESRLRLFRQPQFSIMARSTAFNTYILSVMPYTISYFGLTSCDLNQLRQQAVKFILRRHWLDAETMPYALKWIGVATVLDPGLAATIASTGL